MKNIRLSFIAILALFGAAPAYAHPESVSQNTHEAAAQIDALLAAHWKTVGVTGNSPISDETFLRRIYLDLAGRIPTSEEASTFLESPKSDKRSLLIHELLDRESYVSNFYNFWADILRFKSTAVNRAGVVEAAYEKFIKQSLRANKPYDQFVREMLSAKGYAWENGAVGYYLRDPEMPLDNMAITTRIFLGTRIECAQCHDHPFDKWKQTEFYHLAAFTYGNKTVDEALGGVRDAFGAREQAILDDFNKEKAAATDGGKAAEKRKKERLDAMEFRKVLNIIRHGIGQLLSPIGLNRKPNTVLKLPFDFHQPDGKPGDLMKPHPIFGTPSLSPGDDLDAVFANWVTSPDNPCFTKVLVNRFWRKMFGAALLEPLDDLHDDTKAMAPEVEAYLEKLIVAQHYNMRAFLEVIANTHAYQSAVSREEFTRGGVCHFQGPLLRRMTAEQIWDSLVTLASYEPDARNFAREGRNERRIAISHMVCDAYLNYDGRATVDLGYASLANENAIEAKEKVARESQIEGKRKGDKESETDLRREIGRLERERNEAYVRDFLTPLITNLAQKVAGKNAQISVDETYSMNKNPALCAVETWRKMYLPGYGPAPKTKAQVEAESRNEEHRFAALAAKLDYAEKDRAAFVAYCEKARTEWMRASELDSPAPRGHFLRTMGQSDRDFVENANPNASIPQALALMNSELISSKGLLSPYSPLMHAIQKAATEGHARMDAIFLAFFSRHATPDENALWAASNSNDVTRLVYALLNTKQFIFIQ